MSADLPVVVDDEELAAFRSFVDRCGPDQRIVVFHDFDADGVSAGVVLAEALRRSGRVDVVRRSTDREREAWSESNRRSIADLEPDRLFVLDLGSRSEPLVDGVPTCFIDHHRPEGVPEGAILISGYSREPSPNTSLMTLRLCCEIADVSDLEWIAALGTLSDLGEKNRFDIIQRARGDNTLRDLKEVTALVNAARRASSCEPEAAARALESHRTPRELLRSDSDDVALLRAARDEVREALAEAKRAAPVFSQDVALIRIDSPCQVHPVIAQIWRTRLPKFIVIVANSGYRPGRVNFSMRTASNANLLDFLGAIDLGEGVDSYARGHDQASGGSLPFEQWNLLLEKLGFDRDVMVGPAM